MKILEQIRRLWMPDDKRDINVDNMDKRYLLNNVVGSKIMSSAFPTIIQNSVGDANFKHTAPTLREYARELQKNNPYIRNYFRNVTNFVVGEGITLQAKVKNDSKNYDTVANQVIENAWYDWCTNYCKVGQKMNFVKVQQKIVETYLRDGEIFIIMLKGDQYGKYGFSLQILEADMVNFNLNESLTSGNYIRYGIEYDQLHTPIAVYVSKFTMGPETENTWNPEKYTRVLMENVIHLYNQDRFSQGRGFSAISSVVGMVKMLNGTEEAGITALRIGASKIGFLSRQSGDMEYTGDTMENGNWVNTLDPGQVEILPDGFSFNSWDPSFPDQAVVPFLRHILHSIAIGLGVSYTTLTMDLSQVNYSSIRAGSDIEKKLFKNLQQMLITEFLNVVYTEWLKQAFAYNALQPLPMSKLWKFTKFDFMAGEEAYVNPLDDVNADILAINNGLKSYSQVLAKRGIDFADHVEKIKMEKQMLSEAGLDFSQNKPAK